MAKEKKRDLNQQLSSFGKGNFYNEGGYLAYIFQCAAIRTGITFTRWGSLMYDFIMDPTNNVPPNRRDQTSARGNFTKEFLKRNMTWKVFLKGLKFLQIYKFDVSFRFYRENNEIIDFSTTIPVKQRRTPSNAGQYQKDSEIMQNNLTADATTSENESNKDEA